MVAVCPNDLPDEPPIDIVLQFASQSLTYRAKLFFDEASQLVPQRFIPEAVRYCCLGVHCTALYCTRLLHSEVQSLYSSL